MKELFVALDEGMTDRKAVMFAALEKCLDELLANEQAVKGTIPDSLTTLSVQVRYRWNIRGGRPTAVASTHMRCEVEAVETLNLDTPCSAPNLAEASP